MTKLSKRGAMLRDLVAVLNFNGEEVRERDEIARISFEFEPDDGPHTIVAETYGESTVLLNFTVDPETARKLILAYDQRDEPAPIDAVIAALDKAIKAADEGAASMSEIQERKDDEEAAILEEALIKEAATLRKIRDIAIGAPVDEEMPRLFFTPAEAVALAKGIRFDAVSAAAGDWPWYVLSEKGEDGEYDHRAVQRDGEWRVYFESAAEAVNTLGL